MGTTQSGKVEENPFIDGEEYFGVIRGAVDAGTVGMIIEHSFHTQTEAASWLLRDENLQRLAKVEAAVIAEYFQMDE
jgi:hypothetical protein